MISSVPLLLYMDMKELLAAFSEGFVLVGVELQAVHAMQQSLASRYRKLYGGETASVSVA
jgi:hypothetical protein